MHVVYICECVTLIYCTIMLYTDDGVGESEFDNLAVQPSSQKMAAVRKTPLSIATSEGTLRVPTHGLNVHYRCVCVMCDVCGVCVVCRVMCVVCVCVVCVSCDVCACVCGVCV